MNMPAIISKSQNEYACSYTAHYDVVIPKLLVIYLKKTNNYISNLVVIGHEIYIYKKNII